MFSKARLSPNDIGYAYAGIRAMPFEANPDRAAMSAQHFFQDRADDKLARMISVVGGSLSMAAAVARDCAGKVGIRVAEPKGLAAVDPGTLNPQFEQWVVEVAEAGRISEESAGAIVEWHGKAVTGYRPYGHEQRRTTNTAVPTFPSTSWRKRWTPT